MKLTQAVEDPENSSLAVPDGTSVTLDLNGQALTIDSAAFGCAGVGVPDGAELTIMDSGESGKLDATAEGRGAGIGGRAPSVLLTEILMTLPAVQDR